MLACITTVVQKPYEELWTEEWAQVAQSKRGIYGDMIDTAFEHAGLRKNTDYWCISIPEYIPLNHVRQLLQGRRAIIQVRSLNTQGWHLVYWSGKTLYDPSNKQHYQWLEQLYPAYVWVFDECGLKLQ